MMNNQKIIKSNKNIWRWVTVSILVLVAVILMSSQADAKIVVEGDREFRDDVNECLATYRNNPGIVGDVIRELENSENTHKISEGDEWENTPSNEDDAFNGTGSGTETRISKEKLEEIKQRIDALKNKDFCTAFLHEMWHAVDADRGEWSNDKKDNVWEDEIEATMFQNFLHAIRGVSPRTSYGGIDISKYLLIDDYEVETPESSAGDSEPATTPEPDPEPEPEPQTTAISVIAYQGTHILLDQLRTYSSEGCECCNEAHYHAANGVSVTAVDGRTFPDPFADCGFGKVSENPVVQIETSD